MPLIYEADCFIPVLQVWAQRNYRSAEHVSDLMLAARTTSERAVRVDFVGLGSLMVTPSMFEAVGTERFPVSWSELVTGLGFDEMRNVFASSATSGLWEHDDVSFVDFSVGPGSRNLAGVEARDGLRSFSWSFDENVVVRVSACSVTVREFDCPLSSADPVVNRDRLLLAAIALPASDGGAGLEAR